MDFEGWLNGQLNTMYAQVGTNSGKNIRFEIDVVLDGDGGDEVADFRSAAEPLTESLAPVRAIVAGDELMV